MRALTVCLPLIALASCGESEPQSTEELVQATSQGDEKAMTELENLVRAKVKEDTGPVNEADAAMAALYSSNPKDLADLAESGNAQASFLYGQRLMSQKDDAGKQWMEQAAAANYIEAVYFVGKCKFHGGGGFDIDAPAGQALLEKAAADGHAQAAFDLGVAYRYGLDVTQNNELALEWYEKAKAAGFTAAEAVQYTVTQDGTTKVYEVADRIGVFSDGFELRIPGAKPTEVTAQRFTDGQVLGPPLSL